MERSCVAFKLKPGKKDEYIKRHNEIWPELVDTIRKYGFINQTIFINDNLVVAYIECEGNLKEQSEQYAKEEISISWQEYFKDIIEERYDKFNDTRYLQFEEIWHLD